MLGEVGEPFVVEYASTEMLDQTIDVFLVGRDNAERRAEMLARQREAMAL